MNRETLYASLAGCVSFVLIAYGSYWYFSPARPAANPVTESGSSPAKAVVAIPAETKEPPPIVIRPSAPDNASPLPVVPSRSAPPTPTAYGSAVDAGPRKAAPSLQNDGEGERTLRAMPRPRPTQTVQDRKVTRAERKRTRSRPEDD